jgi:hypothetical protein
VLPEFEDPLDVIGASGTEYDIGDSLERDRSYSILEDFPSP